MVHLHRPRLRRRRQPARVTVVIPCYNYGHYLEGGIRSVVEQSEIDADVIVVDDASPDGSGGVADELVDASPEEILRSEKIDPFDVAETALYLATLGKYSVVHQIVIDRLGADW